MLFKTHDGACFLRALELIKHSANEQEMMRGWIKALRKSPYLHFVLGGLGGGARAPSGLRQHALCWLLKNTHTYTGRLHGWETLYSLFNLCNHRIKAWINPTTQRWQRWEKLWDDTRPALFCRECDYKSLRVKHWVRWNVLGVSDLTKISYHDEIYHDK